MPTMLELKAEIRRLNEALTIAESREGPSSNDMGVAGRVAITRLRDSVSGDTVVETEDGPRTIEDLFHADHDSDPRTDKERVRPHNLKAYAVDERGIVHLGKVVSVIRHLTDKPLYRLVYNGSQHLDITADHSLMGWHYNRQRVIPVDFTKDLHRSIVTGLGIRYLRGRPTVDSGHPDYLFEYLGYFVGNGCLYKSSGKLKGVGTACGLDWKAVAPLLGKMARGGYIRSAGPASVKGDVSSWAEDRLVPLLLLCYSTPDDRNSHTKRVPPFLNDETEEHIAAFLRGYFSADGGVLVARATPARRRRLNVRACSVSEPLCRGIARLLSCVGVASSVYTGKIKKTFDGAVLPQAKTVYYVQVRDNDRYRNRVGFLQPRKRKLLAAMPAPRPSCLSKKDVISTTPSSVILLGPSSDYVYDLEVEGYHTFFANGIAAHNTDYPELIKAVEQIPAIYGEQGYLAALGYCRTSIRSLVDAIVLDAPRTGDLVRAQHRLHMMLNEGEADLLMLEGQAGQRARMEFLEVVERFAYAPSVRAAFRHGQETPAGIMGISPNSE